VKISYKALYSVGVIMHDDDDDDDDDDTLDDVYI
jgi:hypothetical protein